MTTPEKIMEQAQVFASAWALVGSRFDSGDGMEKATEQKDSLKQMVDALTKERDALTRANKDVIDWFDAIKSDYDKLLAAGKLALEALNQSVPGEYDFVDCFEAREALKAAGVS